MHVLTGATGARRRLGRAGITLTELMVAMVLMGGVFAAISALFLRALGDYRDQTMQGTAHQQAAQAIRLMQTDVRAAIRVSEASPTRLTVVLPSVHWDAAQGEYVPDVPLVDGEAITYYQGTESGTPDTYGPYLWRARRPLGAADFTPETQPLATSIEQVAFTYEYLPPPDDHTVRAVEARVVAGERLGAEHVSKAHQTRMTLRNVVVEH
jgi:type II secretory pathway pseudopilin PulG